MSRKEKMKWNGRIVSVELLHELASDNRIREINLGDSVSGKKIRGCKEVQKEYDQWELRYSDGERVLVYV
ncbi:MAG: hypothetical protein Q4F21_08360 [Lachnospiraceae bacterium]|nr:hypothetical protein [Lachnospiraceae bacterium]